MRKYQILFFIFFILFRLEFKVKADDYAVAEVKALKGRVEVNKAGYQARISLFDGEMEDVR